MEGAKRGSTLTCGCCGLMMLTQARESGVRIIFKREALPFVAVFLSYRPGTGEKSFAGYAPSGYQVGKAAGHMGGLV